MLHIPEIAEAGILWLGGKKVYAAGVPGASGEFVFSVKNTFASFSGQNGVTEIVIQAASGTTIGDMGGLVYSARVGSESLLLKDSMFRRVALMGVIGAILMMALYHLILFISRPREKIYLWYVLYALVISLRMSMETNGLVQLFAPRGMDGLLSRLYLASFAAQVLFITLFTFEAFRIPYRPLKNAWRAVYFICGGIMAVNILSYLMIPATAVWLAYLSILPFAALVAGAAWRMLKEKQRNHMGLYFTALLLFFFWGVGAKMLADNIFYVPAVLSNVFMALAQSVVLSVNYAEAKRREEILTERNSLLDRLNRAKTDFLQDLNHEIKKPLTVIAAGIDYAGSQIRKAGGSLPIVGETLETIRKETQRIGRMLDGMVTLAYVNEISENRERVDFASLLASSVEIFRIPIEMQNSSLRVEIPSGLPDVFVESDSFLRVMDNLFSNAVNNIKNGRITLSADYGDGYVTVRLADTGMGVAPELLPRVFERGVSGRDGMGYGLYICKTVVEAHGGTIKIESEPDNGTVVTFTVPVYGGQDAGHRR